MSTTRWTVRTVAIALGALAFTAVAPGGAAGQRPGGGGRNPQSFRRPAILDVSGDKIVKLNPVARLLEERQKLGLSADQSTRVDSINAALLEEIGWFVAEIDSLRSRRLDPADGGSERQGDGRGGGRPRGGGRGGGRGDGDTPAGYESPLARLIDAIAQVKLRYDAALLDIARILTDDQRHRAAKLVEKERARMEEYATPPRHRPGG